MAGFCDTPASLLAMARSCKELAPAALEALYESVVFDADDTFCTYAWLRGDGREARGKLSGYI